MIVLLPQPVLSRQALAFSTAVLLWETVCFTAFHSEDLVAISHESQENGSCLALVKYSAAEY